MHWARDAAEHNHKVHGILRDYGATSLIESKAYQASDVIPCVSARRPEQSRPCRCYG
jgi:hypothetical protein